MRPLQQGTQIFAERGTPSSAIGVGARLKAMDMHDGESVHITTRGKIIESSIVDQANTEEVQAAAMIRAKHIALRYIDLSRPSRHK